MSTSLPAPSLTLTNEAAAVGNGFFAFATTTSVDVVDVKASTNQTSLPLGSGEELSRIDIATDAQGETRIAFQSLNYTNVVWATVGTDRTLSAVDAGGGPMNNVTAFVRNPYVDGGGTPIYSFFTPGEPSTISHGALGATNLSLDENDISAGVVQLAVTSTGPAWLFSTSENSNVGFVNSSGGQGNVAAGTDRPSSTAQSFAAGPAILFVANSGGSVDEIAPGNGGVQRGVALLADGGTPTTLHQVVVQGDSLYWFDSGGLHRNLLSTIP